MQEKVWLRESYHMTLTEKALHERLERFEIENKELLEKIKSLTDTSSKEIQDLVSNFFLRNSFKTNFFQKRKIISRQ